MVLVPHFVFSSPLFFEIKVKFFYIEIKTFEIPVFKVILRTHLILRSVTSYANDSKEISLRQNSINSKVNLEEPIASSKYRTLGGIQIICDTFMTAFHVTFYYKITVLTTNWLLLIKA